MVLDSATLKDVLLVSALVALAVVSAESGAVNALPGFSDHTGPTEMEVTSLERLDSGCRDDVATYAGGSTSGGNYSQVSFVETGDREARSASADASGEERSDDPRADPDLSAWTERTSPPGADLGTFRVHVESHSRADADDADSADVDPRADADATANASCELGVQYRIEVTTSGGSPEGLLPDDHGTRVLWLENGDYAGCSASHTGSLETRCQRFTSDPDRTWANATTAAD